ncbi:hypothetical protein BT69DRAFT_53880 [Atractiella rhizophila]|nr:hypothetical protein BT69DRAFT_53880 [Atractiella rhizophila]
MNGILLWKYLRVRPWRRVNRWIKSSSSLCTDSPPLPSAEAGTSSPVVETPTASSIRPISPVAAQTSTAPSSLWSSWWTGSAPALTILEKMRRKMRKIRLLSM